MASDLPRTGGPGHCVEQQSGVVVGLRPLEAGMYKANLCLVDVER